MTLADKRQFPTTVIGSDPKTDVGLIKIDGGKLPAIPLGNSDLLKSGHWVLAVGSPYEYIQTVTTGIISATGRNALGISDYENFRGKTGEEAFGITTSFNFTQLPLSTEARHA